MRQHLLSCLEQGVMSCFPSLGRRRVPIGMRVRKSCSETIYCICRMPNDKTEQMIMCDTCLKWYHTNCMKVANLMSDKNWVCTLCEKYVKDMC